MKRWLSFCILILFFQASYSQGPLIPIKFTPILSETNITLSDSTLSVHNDVLISSLKFYLTGFSFSKNGITVWKEKDSYHLLDISDPNSMTIDLQIPEKTDFDAIHFLFGTDSLTNVSGAMGGDLDPTKGMYWAWNSGYINFKLEGVKNRQPYEYHLGGYMPPYATVQNIQLTTSSNSTINIILDLTKFFDASIIEKTTKVMSPGNTARELSEIISSLFYIDEKK